MYLSHVNYNKFLFPSTLSLMFISFAETMEWKFIYNCWLDEFLNLSSCGSIAFMIILSKNSFSMINICFYHLSLLHAWRKDMINYMIWLLTWCQCYMIDWPAFTNRELPVYQDTPIWVQGRAFWDGQLTQHSYMARRSLLRRQQRGFQVIQVKQETIEWVPERKILFHMKEIDLCYERAIDDIHTPLCKGMIYGIMCQHYYFYDTFYFIGYSVTLANDHLSMSILSQSLLHK